MYITSLKLKDIKCFKNLEYKFKSQKGASLVIAGDNGDGKSTILRSIAISLCDKWTAAGLLRELAGEFVNSDPNVKTGTIILKLKSGRTVYTIKTIIKWNENETYEYPHRRITKNQNGRTTSVIDEKFPWKNIFATGYGAGLRTQGTQDFQDYFTGDSIYSLFRDDVTLQNPELALRRIKDSITQSKDSEAAQEVEDAILSWLGELLLLENEELEVRPNGVQIIKKGRKTGGKPLAASGDGYKAVTAVVLDMLAWWFLNKFYNSETGTLKKSAITAEKFKNVSGIVIIDEIEQHLHPRWQREILPRFKETFPKVQFIVSTHSPLVLSSADYESLILFDNEAVKKDVSGWRAGDVLKVMGSEFRGGGQSDANIKRYIHLYNKKLRGNLVETFEKSELNSLEILLKGKFSASGDPIIQSLQLLGISKYLED